MSETTFTLIRHPEPAVRGICYGSLDVPLSEAGIRHAHDIAEALAAEPFAAIYTSPLQRCAETARLLAEGRECPLETLDALRELNFGRFEGRTFDDLMRDYPDLYRRWMGSPTEVEFPGGESFATMRRRVLAAAGELHARHAGQKIALVTHGGVIRILLTEAYGMDPRRMFEIELPYGSIRRVALPSDPAAPLSSPAATTPRPR
jgi:alpha-ribazole phosphatase